MQRLSATARKETTNHSNRARGWGVFNERFGEYWIGLDTKCTEQDGSVVNYGYDGAHRLTSESRTGTNPYSKTYVVDGVGNRTSQTVGGVTTTFTLNTDDELSATSGGIVNSYGYNANGEQTTRTLSGT